MKKNILLLFLLLPSFYTSAQIIESPKNDFKNFFKSGNDLFSAPAHFTSKDWILFSSTLGITAASIFIDDEIKTIAQRNKGSFGNVIFKVDDLYHIEFMAASIAAFYIYGISSKNSEVRNLGLRLAEATAYSSSIMGLTKFVFGRGRPKNLDDPTVFYPLNTTWDYTSFPSGHSTLAFAYSTVMASVYNNFFWKFSWFSLAALVGTARVYHNEHWFSDVVLGAAIGYFVGDFINRHSTNQKETNTAAPLDQSKGFSVSFGFAF